jgi:hypothetical protein
MRLSAPIYWRSWASSRLAMHRRPVLQSFRRSASRLEPIYALDAWTRLIFTHSRCNEAMLKFAAYSLHVRDSRNSTCDVLGGAHAYDSTRCFSSRPRSQSSMARM